jgi:class 3 adenylate cyclase
MIDARRTTPRRQAKSVTQVDSGETRPVPLFMDRHDLPGTTSEQVAQAHVLDVAASARHGVQFLSYWFDSDNGAAFCLARAPSPEEMQAVHRESHGLVSNEIIRVAEANVLKFLGRIEDPADHTRVTSAFRTVLFTDLKGSTSLLHELGQSPYMVLLTEHDLIIRRALVSSRGREVKHTGDGIMASFEDVTGALVCASAIQDGFQQRNAVSGPPALSVRIGMAAGEPVDHDDDLFGSTVNLASRICEVADGGQVLVSELVRDLGIKHGFRFREVGPRALRGFPGPSVLFELQQGRVLEAVGLRGRE